MRIRLSWRVTVALSAIVALAGVSVVGTGCAALNEILAPPPPAETTQADVDAAKAAKDVAKLEQICWNKLPRTKIKVMDAACDAVVDVLAEQGNFDKLSAICDGQPKTEDWRGGKRRACGVLKDRASAEAVAAVLHASCADLPATFTAKKDALFHFGAKGDTMRKDREAFVKIGLRAAECERWDFIIEGLMHWGEAGGYGEVLTRTLFEKIPDFEDKVLAYMKSHLNGAGSFKHSDYAFDHYTTVLNERHMFKNCAKYFPYADRVPDRTWQMFNWYFRKAQCKGAAKLAVKRLGSDRASTRQGACKTLAALGSKRKHLKLIERLAKSDPFYILHKDTIPAWKEYAVRDTCAKAANQLSLK